MAVSVLGAPRGAGEIAAALSARVAGKPGCRAVPSATSDVAVDHDARFPRRADAADARGWTRRAGGERNHTHAASAGQPGLTPLGAIARQTARAERPLEDAIAIDTHQPFRKALARQSALLRRSGVLLRPPRARWPSDVPGRIEGRRVPRLDVGGATIAGSSPFRRFGRDASRAAREEEQRQEREAMHQGAPGIHRAAATQGPCTPGSIPLRGRNSRRSAQGLLRPHLPTFEEYPPQSRRWRGARRPRNIR